MNRAHFDLKLRSDRPRKDGTLGIYLYANINGKLSWYSTNQSVNEKNWNKKNKEVKSSWPEWNKINSYISLYLNKSKDYITQCNLNGVRANSQNLDAILRSINHQTNSYFDFVEQYLKKHSLKYAPKTLKGFQTHLKKLKEFRSKVEFEDINNTFWNEFETFLKGKENRLNTIHKQYMLLNKFVNKAIELGIIRENLLRNLKVRQEIGNRVYLTKSELDILQDIYTTKKLTKPGLNQVLKYFLFASYTGLRISDMKKLKFKNILNREKIYMKSQKTGVLIDIPLPKKAISLIDNETLPNAVVFKMFSEPVTNRHLKDIMKIAGIQKNISFHCARHTFATNTFAMTGNIAIVSNILGHRSLKTTQIYAKVLEEEKKKAMKMWDNT